MPPAIWAGALIGGRWSDRWSQSTPRGRLFVPMIGLAFAAPCIFVGLASGSLPVVVGAFMLFSLGLTFATINIMPTLCLIADERYRATGFGIINLVSSAVGGLSIYLGGFVRDAHLEVGQLFGCGAVLMLACAALLWFIRPGEHALPRSASPAAEA
jgi:MFS family permease